ncbi:MAG: hypothetical protein WAZ19_14785 [Anaerolineae bacterium]
MTHSKPSRNNGWLKVTLASSGVALTILGTGMVARQQDAVPATSIASLGSAQAVDLQPIPTVAPTQSFSRRGRRQRNTPQLQAPNAASGQSFNRQPLTQSRSSR